MLIAIAGLVVVGCEDFLDREPLSELSTGTFFKSKGDMRTWVHGTYDELQTALIGTTGFVLETGELRSDNFGNTGYGDTRVYLNAIDASQSQWNWEYLYRVIDRCNVGIINIPTIPNLLPADYADYVGQLHGLRALMYFYLIRAWGDVPLTTEPWDGSTASKANLPRSSVDEVKALIMDDLDKAISMISSDVAAARRHYFNRAAAWALKTDVHMWFKEYPAAIAASQYFIGNANFTLVTNAAGWKDIFLNPTVSKETIFTMNWSQDPTLPDGTNQWAQRVGASNTNNTYQISRKLFNVFVDRLRSGKGKDGRFWNVLDTIKIYRDGTAAPIGYNHYGRNGTAKNTKFSVASTVTNEQWVVLSSTTSAVQLPVLRLADVLLLRAEALNRTGDGNGALTIVNSIRSRVGYTADSKTEVSLADQNAIEDLILLERQLEFMGEGKRWFDLMRTNKVIEVMDPVMRQRQQDYNVEITGFGHPGRAKFPIYYKEFESNPAIRGTQNEPYTEG